MLTLTNNRLLHAIRHEPVDATPIWLMRQAGRYLPEYRALRAKAGSFLALCKTPELACEVTLQPLKRFPLDAAILFSDILTIPDAMGLGLHFIEGEGPCFTMPLRRVEDIAALGVPDPETDLRYVLEAIRLIRHELGDSLPLIGFCGSPWTVACYMVEGRAQKTFPLIQSWARENPAAIHTLLARVAQAISLHCQAQIAAGVDVIMLFDTWGSLLDNFLYEIWSLRYLQQIIHSLASYSIPIILFCPGGESKIPLLMQSGCQVIGVDATVRLDHAKQLLAGRPIALQGNLSPQLLYESPAIIEQAVARILAEIGPSSGHIFNLGHGIPQDVSPDHVAVLIEAVHRLSASIHEKKATL